MTRLIIRAITIAATLHARTHKPPPGHHCTWTRVSYYTAGSPGRCLYGCTCGRRIVQ